MEQEKQNLLEIIDRPAFIVRNGMITDSNQMAKNRMIPLDKPISDLLPEDCHAYENYQGGLLYLTLQLGWIPCGATVMRQLYGDLFLLDRDTDQSQLQVLALAAQQLRTPLSNVMTVADCLFPQLESETQKEQASQMHRALFQLMRLISNMADAERYANLETPHYENTELCAFLREIIESADVTLAQTKVAVRYVCPDMPVLTMIDREIVKRAVYNLLSNAVKFSAPGDQVTVKLTSNKKMASLSVEDQGDGVAPHVQGTLFHRYMREPSIEDSRFGLGLGITMVRSAARIHGGTLLVEQTAGTRVTMTMAIRKDVPGMLRSPQLRIGDYAGGRDLGLLEFSETLPTTAYENSN